MIIHIRGQVAPKLINMELLLKSHASKVHVLDLGTCGPSTWAWTHLGMYVPRW